MSDKNTTYIIGIAGGTGSGKSTFAKRLKDAHPAHVTMISYDNYYYSQDGLSFGERQFVNYDCPEALETDLLFRHLQQLCEGKSINMPVYDFITHLRTNDTTVVSPSKVIIVDGILIFNDERLRNIFNLRIFVETDADERILRRVRRDVQERNRSIDSIIEQYLDTVKPMHNMFVEPQKSYADIIIHGGMNQNAFDIVNAKIGNIIKN